jgi:cytochrome d ubiquinol oxidase subunit I
MRWLASAADNLGTARAQMALSLGWHIVVACLGVGLPLLILLAEWLGQRRGAPHLQQLARRWARAAAVLFAVGAVSGTILSFEMGVLWPHLMGTFGEVFGFPFALEGIAFFLEAIFVGIYLYGWDRLSPRRHLLSGLPVVISGAASAFFVVTANAWMNEPTGFRLVDGRLVDGDPIAAMFNGATPVETAHMILAAYMVSGFLVASVYATSWLRGRRTAYHRAGFILAFTVAAVATPAQIVVGDIAARHVADRQPAKLAAMEGLFHTGSDVAEHIGGVAIDGRLQGAIEIPGMLSLLIGGNTQATVVGLDHYPQADWPAVNVVHPAFDVMVGCGFALLGIAGWLGLIALRRRRLPQSPWFWRAAALSGGLATVAMESGWVVTEVGRQPWVVYGVMRTADAVNPAPGLVLGLVLLVPTYIVLTVTTLAVLRRLSRRPIDGGTGEPRA